MNPLDDKQALAVLMAACEAGAIKLIGPSEPRFATETAKADASYLLTLLAELQKAAPTL